MCGHDHNSLARPELTNHLALEGAAPTQGCGLDAPHQLRLADTDAPEDALRLAEVVGVRVVAGLLVGAGAEAADRVGKLAELPLFDRRAVQRQNVLRVQLRRPLEVRQCRVQEPAALLRYAARMVAERRVGVAELDGQTQRARRPRPVALLRPCLRGRERRERVFAGGRRCRRRSRRAARRKRRRWPRQAAAGAVFVRAIEGGIVSTFAPRLLLELPRGRGALHSRLERAARAAAAQLKRAPPLQLRLDEQLLPEQVLRRAAVQVGVDVGPRRLLRLRLWLRLWLRFRLRDLLQARSAPNFRSGSVGTPTPAPCGGGCCSGVAVAVAAVRHQPPPPARRREREAPLRPALVQRAHAEAAPLGQAHSRVQPSRELVHEGHGRRAGAEHRVCGPTGLLVL